MLFVSEYVNDVKITFFSCVALFQMKRSTFTNNFKTKNL